MGAREEAARKERLAREEAARLPVKPSAKLRATDSQQKLPLKSHFFRPSVNAKPLRQMLSARSASPAKRPPARLKKPLRLLAVPLLLARDGRMRSARSWRPTERQMPPPRNGTSSLMLVSLANRQNLSAHAQSGPRLLKPLWRGTLPSALSRSSLSR